MEPRLVTAEGLAVLGVIVRIDPQATDYRAIWCDHFDPVHDQIRALASGDSYYGVYFDTDEPGRVDMLLGMAVEGLSVAPAGLSLRAIPASLQAVFDCTMAELGRVWQAAYAEWLPASGYEADPAGACYEVFPPGVDDGRGVVSVHIPIRPAGSGA